VIEESFALRELAEGRNVVKTQALHEIDKLQTELLNAVTRFRTEETARQQSQANQLHLNRLCPSNEFTQPSIDDISKAMEKISMHDVQLRGPFAQLEKDLKEIHHSVEHDPSDIGRRESEIRQMFQQVQKQNFNIGCGQHTIFFGKSSFNLNHRMKSKERRFFNQKWLFWSLMIDSTSRSSLTTHGTALATHRVE
jgi:hypothetical protein